MPIQGSPVGRADTGVVAPYRVGNVDRTESSSHGSTWKVTFLRLAGPANVNEKPDTVDLTMNSAAFVRLDLDRGYALGDLIDLREIGAVD
jgi:hypothetical protein